VCANVFTVSIEDMGLSIFDFSFFSLSTKLSLWFLDKLSMYEFVLDSKTASRTEQRNDIKIAIER
jgi:hypothetical protein